MGEHVERIERLRVRRLDADGQPIGEWINVDGPHIQNEAGQPRPVRPQMDVPLDEGDET